ncbi:MAG TPA: DUF2075 domain-containing protein, partial [Lentisphaeria bacterium]|nr:DUF2075 domain-containing protein [Lentisphaeria bacterium]
MSRFFYSANISDFFHQQAGMIVNSLVQGNPFDLTDTQRYAWNEEIGILKEILCPDEMGQIIFEYSIPRLGKRIDVVLLLDGIVFVLEFKVGQSDYQRQDLEQVWDYALDLKNFHEKSHDLFIAPILVSTAATTASKTFHRGHYNSQVFDPICTNPENLRKIIDTICRDCESNADLSDWMHSRYMPTPTIVQAASALYLNHSVKDITRSDASAESLWSTGEQVMNIIEHARLHHEKSICFVTGVPGAGKTLVGLNVAVKQFGKGDLAVYLSGNQPLVSVLTEALARDKKRQFEEKNSGKRCNITDARRSVRSFIQNIHHYRKNALAKLKRPIENGILEIDPAKAKKHNVDG